MKKDTRIILAIAMFMALVLGLVAYAFVSGGPPHFENFEKVSADYETVAKIALDYYKANSPEEEELVIYLRENQLVHDNTPLQLSDTQTASIKTICEKFDYLRVCKEAVFFCEDETGYYGLVYSKHPLLALYKAELPQNGRDFHRINNRWYEWGVFAG